ncbi:MAG: ABA4-like family protein [Alphaproteobacteria bacterium]
MSYETLFQIFNLGVLPFWALLILLPNARVTEVLVHSALIPAIYGVAYITFLVIATTGDGPAGDFSSLEGIMVGFASPVGMLAGWIHYLVFDMFVGAWEARDAKRHGISHWVMIPILILTLMAGPLGLLIYVILRGVTRQVWGLREPDAA